MCKDRAEHSGVIPDESYTELTSEDERLRTVVRLQQQAQVLQSEIDWRRREEQFRLFIEGVQDYAIFMLDLQGRVSTWNAGAERIKGYKPAEVITFRVSIPIQMSAPASPGGCWRRQQGTDTAKMRAGRFARMAPCSGRT